MDLVNLRFGPVATSTAATWRGGHGKEWGYPAVPANEAV
jgi:hypothetical protein